MVNEKERRREKLKSEAGWCQGLAASLMCWQGTFALFLLLFFLFLFSRKKREAEQLGYFSLSLFLLCVCLYIHQRARALFSLMAVSFHIFIGTHTCMCVLCTIQCSYSGLFSVLCVPSPYSCVWKAMRGTDSFVLLGKPKGFYSLLSGALFALAIQLVSDDT